MIRAIVFDCFGVLTSDGWLPFKKKHFGHDEALMQQATDLNKQVDAGLADYGAFLRDVAKLADVPPEEARRAIEDNVADEALFDYIRTELKPHYQIGLLSNAGADWLSELFTPQQVALFEATALSYETGFVKPDKRAFATIADRLGVEISECVLIDDQERYCDGARQAGMEAIWYRSLDQMQPELEQLLGDSKP